MKVGNICAVSSLQRQNPHLFLQIRSVETKRTSPPGMVKMLYDHSLLLRKRRIMSTGGDLLFEGISLVLSTTVSREDSIIRICEESVR